jgi:hypothetical protein
MRPLPTLALAVLSLSGGLACLTACGGATSDAAAEPAASAPAGPIRVAVVNRTDRDITGVVVYGQGLGKDLGYQTIAAGDTERLQHDDLRVPARLSLDYTDHRGDRHYNAFPVPRQFTQGSTADLTLTVTPAGKVRVSR